MNSGRIYRPVLHLKLHLNGCCLSDHDIGHAVVKRVGMVKRDMVMQGNMTISIKSTL